jgi:hypothetical protein
MVPPSPSPEQGWTTQQLKEYVDMIFAERLRVQQSAETAMRDHVASQVGQIQTAVEAEKKVTSARFDSAREAIVKADAATEKRFDGVNEFRAQLTDQALTFLPRETFEQILGQYDAWRSTVESRLNMQAGQAAGSDHLIRMMFLAIGAMAAVLSIVVVIANVLLR